MPDPIPPHPLGYTLPQAFNSDHLAAIADAKKRFFRIRREIAVAVFDAWSVAIFGGITVICSLGSASGLFVGLGMAVVAFIEFRSIARLRQLDPDAPRALARNQLLFAAILIIYAGYNLLFPSANGLSAEVRDAAAADPDIASTLSGLSSMINHILYFGVIAFAIIFQGGCAVYHFGRTTYLKKYLDDTPPWLLQLHSAGLMN